MKLLTLLSACFTSVLGAGPYFGAVYPGFQSCLKSISLLALADVWYSQAIEILRLDLAWLRRCESLSDKSDWSISSVAPYWHSSPLKFWRSFSLRFCSASPESQWGDIARLTVWTCCLSLFKIPTGGCWKFMLQSSELDPFWCICWGDSNLCQNILQRCRSCSSACMLCTNFYFGL